MFQTLCFTLSHSFQEGSIHHPACILVDLKLLSIFFCVYSKKPEEWTEMLEGYFVEFVAFRGGKQCSRARSVMTLAMPTVRHLQISTLLGKASGTPLQLVSLFTIVPKFTSTSEL